MTSSRVQAVVIEEITSGPGRPAVPAGFIIPPSPKETAALKARDQLVAALKPDGDTMQQVMANPALLAGFDDPDVMRAVDEIAKNPASLQKHQSNAKVSVLICDPQHQVILALVPAIPRTS